LALAKDLDSQEFKGKFGGIFALFKTDSNWAKAFPFILICRKVAFSAFLVFFSHDAGK